MQNINYNISMKTLVFEYLYYYSHKDNTSVEEHYHNCYELVYYTEGEGKSSGGGQSYFFKAGDFIIYPPKFPHDEKHFAPVSVHCIGFSADESDINNIPIGLGTDSSRFAINLIEKIKPELRGCRIDYHQMMDLLVTELIITIKRQINRGARDFDDMGYIKQYIKENLSSSIDIDTLSEISGYSPDHFRHMFKKKTGQSPKQFILTQRLELARHMLVTDNCYISNVSSACGFSDLSQFSSMFRKSTGLSPQDYRKINSLRKKNDVIE